MEKILLVLDAMRPSMKAIDFGCYIANLTESKLTGVFLENVLSATSTKGMLMNREYEIGEQSDFGIIEQRRKCCEESIYCFESACTKRNVLYNIHRDRGIPTSEIIEESRFADLIILDAETSFRRKYEGAPTDFVRIVLEKAECPVIISPENFNTINRIVFAYDGSRSSIFSIKQFTYLFPQLKNKEATILQINKENEAIVKEKYKLKEWLKLHYGSIDIKILHGEPRYELIDFALNKKNTLLVMGAYGKSIFSQFFHKSNAEMIIKTIDIPVFITHY